MFKVNAENFNKALEYAAVGGGKGFVLMVNPEKRAIGENKEIQLACVLSSDGEKMGMANMLIKAKDMEKEEVYYASSYIKSAVATLGKITDTICVEAKSSYLQLSDEKKEAVIKVELNESDIVLQIPNTPDDTTMIAIEREKFVNAIRLGGYSAKDSNIAGIDAIGFQLKEEEKKLIVFSRSGETACKAITPIEASKNMAKKGDAWHFANFRFIQNVIQKLDGKLIQITFTPKFIVIQSESARFGAKISEGSVSNSIFNMLDDKGYDYTGTVNKKDLLIAMEIAMVGIKDDKGKYITLETNENGSLKVSSMTGSNKSNVSQKTHEGKMEEKVFYADILKLGLNGCGDEIHYLGKVNPVFLMMDGTDADVDYVSIVAPVNPKKTK